jgi:hypothetical protein
MRFTTRLLVACTVVAPATGLAQSPNTSTIVVLVADESGATVRDARVTVVNTSTADRRDASSGADGSATIAALSVNGSYTVTVTRDSFAPKEARDIRLRAGETATLRVRLLVQSERSEVMVYGTETGVRATAQLGERLDSGQIQQTPILGRKITYLPLVDSAFRSGKGTGDLFLNAVYAVSGAGGRRELTFAVDGATGDEPWGRQTMFSTIPVGAVQEMNVLTNAFSAELGWTASPAVNIVTKSGTNEVHGEAVYLGRPGGQAFQKRVASIGSMRVAPADVPDVLHQLSGALGGPVVRSRTFLFGAADYTRQDRTAYFAGIAATVKLLNGVSSYTGNYRQALANVRLDHRLSAGHALMARVNLDTFSDNNPQDVVSGTTLPSAGREFRRRTSTYQVNATSVLSASMLNEVRFEYQHGDPITSFDPITPSTQFVRAGIATEGESRYSHVRSRQLQLSDTLTRTAGRHYLRSGGSLARATSGGDGTEFGGAFVQGQFTLNPAATAPIPQLALSDATRYTQTFDFGIRDYTNRQWIYAVFVQDTVRLRDDLSADLGLRYDRQTFTDGRKNLAPRLGFGWHPGGAAKTAVRGGYAVYYTMIRANTDAAFTLNGPEGQFTYSAAPGQLGFPGSLTAVPIAFPEGAVLPARNVTIRPGKRDSYSRFFDVSRLDYPDALVNPRSRVGNIGIERQFARGLIVSADYVRQHWTGLDRSLDLNAPALFVRTAPGQVRSAAAADATRPIVPVNNGFRQINVMTNLGVADYDGLQTMARWRTARALVSVSYTLSSATNTTEPNGNGPGPNDFNQLGEAERGPSILDQRHRAVIVASWRLPRDLTIGTVTSLGSARPFNATTGVDNNGDGAANDRPVTDGTVVGRAAFRGSAQYDASVFVEGGLRRGRRQIRLRVEGFNVFNHANILGRIGVYGDAATPNANFGTPNTGLANIDPARMIQFQLRFVF